jgi:hypothetical protein
MGIYLHNSTKSPRVQKNWIEINTKLQIYNGYRFTEMPTYISLYITAARRTVEKEYKQTSS